MENDLKVSICCTAYNHEKYIAKAIEGFISQQTDFKYEIIIHDDASTDRTQEIIKEYERKYPNIIHTIFQKENQYSQGKNVTSEFIAPKTKGKYIALCEGDDYWVDPLKLEKQVKALENNKDCYFCVHQVVEVDEKGVDTGILYPKENYGTMKVSPNDFLEMSISYSFHTSSYMFNGEKWREYNKNFPLFRQKCPVGDEAYILYFANLGSIYYIKDKMSCYRRGVKSSWSQIQNTGDVIKKKCNNITLMSETIMLFDEFSDFKFHEICCKRRAYYLKTLWLLEGKTRNFVKNENRNLFNKFSMIHKLILIVSMFFPNISKKIYSKKLLYANKSKGY